MNQSTLTNDQNRNLMFRGISSPTEAVLFCSRSLPQACDVLVPVNFGKTSSR